MNTLLTKTLKRLIQSHVILAITTFSLAVPLSASAVTGTFAWSVQGVDGENGNIVLDSAGNIIESAFTGQTVTKYDSNKNVIWSHQFDITYQGFGGYLSSHMIVDSANNIYICKLIDYRDVNNVQLAIIGAAKISSGGTLLWTNTYIIDPKAGEHMSAGPMVLGSNGSLYVVGTGANLSSDYPVTILRINTSTGAEQNRVSAGRTLDGGGYMPNSALAVDSANNVYYGGPEGLRSYSSNLQTLRWDDTQSAVRAVVFDAGNNVYAVGYITNSFDGFYFDVRRLNNTSGSVVWIYESEMPSGPDLTNPGGNAIALDSQGQIYAAGTQTISMDNIVKLNPANGNLEWSAGQDSFNGTPVDLAIAVDAYGNVYAVGTDAASQNAGNAVVDVYDPHGNLLWSQSYNGPGNLNDTFTHVVLDNNRNVYATSDSLIPGSPGSGTTQTIPEVVKYTQSGLIINGTYKIINRNSALAMEAFGQHTTNGTPIDQWSYNGGNNQRWTLTSLGGGEFSIVGVQSGRSLDVAGYGTGNGTKVDLWDHNGGANQQFSFTPTSNGYFLIVPAHDTGSCIEGVGFSTTNGTPVDLWQINSGNNQQWIFQAP